MNFLKKWYTYQKERFPVLTFGIYIFAIVFGVFCYCNYVGEIVYYENISKYTFITSPKIYTINYYRLIPMFIVAFLQFLMVRIVDEFKDYEEDCKYRPYRPVPRGLITLKELKILFVICAILQIAITYFVSPTAIIYLGIVWIFFAVMSKGFFIKKFLDKHILAEVALDELMMPILVLYLSRFVSYVNPSYSFYSFIDIQNMWKLLLMSYIISWIVEIARKVRCKEDEEEGVKTYTAVFGINGAMVILSVLETILLVVNRVILNSTSYIMLIGFIFVILMNLIFWIKQDRKMAKIAGLSANIYILICYLSMFILIK